MKPNIIASVMLVAGLAGPAFAGCGNGPSTLSQTQLNTILASNFACGQSSSLNAPGWNEKHVGASGGALVEQHGAGIADDENVGSWATSTSGGVGRVTYSYGGVVPIYEVSVVANGNCGSSCTTLPQTYKFCGVGGGAPASLDILVSATLPTLSGCPGNP